MKKFVALCFMTIMAAAFISVQNANAQNTALEQELQDEYKKKIKELRSAGWNISGSTRTLEVALLLHYAKLNDVNNMELVGEVRADESLNTLSHTAINNARTKYAALAGANLKDLLDLSLINYDSVKELQKICIVYEKLLEKEIKGEMVESFSIAREIGHGLMEYKTFFIVNKEAAYKARIRAWERAKEEYELAQKYVNQVSSMMLLP